MTDPPAEIPDLPADRWIDRLVSLLEPLNRVTRPRLMGFPLPPVVRGVGPTPIPRPERLYFWFGEPIDTTRFGSRFDDTSAARALRDEVKRAILVGIQFLRDERDQDPNRGLLTRLRRRGE